MPTGETTTGIPSGTITHPTYATWAPKWRWLSYVYEGSGPFLSGAALIAHPREYLDHTIKQEVPQTETNADGTVVTTGQKIVVSKVNPSPKIPSPKLLERQRLARYENVAAPIVDHKLAALFRQPPTRRVKGAGTGDDAEHAWLEWAEADVDGAGTCLTDFMRDAARIAFIFGHSIILMDRTGGEAEPLTRAQQGTLILRLYAPLDMPDWLQDETGALQEVKLFEIAPRTSLRQGINTKRIRLRYVTPTSFEVVDEDTNGRNQTGVMQGEHGFGALPVAILYGKRRALTPLIGQSVLYDPQLYVDLYNLDSETRELLRKQVFSILNVPLGTGDQAMDVSQAQALMGETTGTANVMFSGQPASFITADSTNVTVYLAVKQALLRTIYRLSNVPFETDSMDAESEGSMKLKREDMNQVLSAHADEVEHTEMDLAKLWFRGTYGPDAWEKEWERVEPTVVYPDTFDTTPFKEILEQAAAVVALPLGRSKTFLLELCKQVLPKILGEISPAVKDEIVKELEKLPDPEQERKDLQAQLATKFSDPEADPGGGGEKPPKKPEQVAAAAAE